jgi:hypothetical protein
MEYNAPALSFLLMTARLKGCEIIHISKLADEDPFIASRPCLGEPSAPLLDITPSGYLALMAELREHLIIEHAETLTCLITTAGGRAPQAASERVQLAPYIMSGHLDDELAAVYYMMDSAGQETTIIYRGLRSVSEIQAYWCERSRLCRDFADRYDATDDDLQLLCHEFDKTVDLQSVNLASFARRLGLDSSESLLNPL